MSCALLFKVKTARGQHVGQYMSLSRDMQIIFRLNMHIENPIIRHTVPICSNMIRNCIKVSSKSGKWLNMNLQKDRNPELNEVVKMRG